MTRGSRVSVSDRRRILERESITQPNRKPFTFPSECVQGRTSSKHKDVSQLLGNCSLRDNLIVAERNMSRCGRRESGAPHVPAGGGGGGSRRGRRVGFGIPLAFHVWNTVHFTRPPHSGVRSAPPTRSCRNCDSLCPPPAPILALRCTYSVRRTGCAR